MSRNPLFQFLRFVLQNTPEIPELRLGELKLSRESYEQTTSKFDLTFTLTRTASGLHGSCNTAPTFIASKPSSGCWAILKSCLTPLLPSPSKI